MSDDADPRAAEGTSAASPVRHMRRLVLPLGLAFVVLIMAVVVLASFTGASPPSQRAKAAEGTTTPAATLPPRSVSIRQAASDSETGLTPDVVAVVNGQAINRQTLELMRATDKAMAELLGRAPAPHDDSLDRLVNSELVAQAVQTTGYQLKEGRVEQQLLNFLHARDKSMADLASVLADNGLTVDEFKAYYERLLLVDQFSRTQAEARDMTVSAFLRQLQHQARISFGPAASEVVGRTGADVAESPPQPAPAESELQDDAASDSESALSPTPLSEAPRGTARGQHAPSFNLPALNYPDADFVTLEDLAGKPTLLSFWTTWCPYCRAQTPVLVEAHEKYADRVQFAGINVKESQQPVANYIQNHDMRYPIGLDADGRIAGQYGVSGFPTTYFLDAEGRVVARHVGQLSTGKLESCLQQLLKTNDS